MNEDKDLFADNIIKLIDISPSFTKEYNSGTRRIIKFILPFLGIDFLAKLNAYLVAENTAIYLNK